MGKPSLNDLAVDRTKNTTNQTKTTCSFYGFQCIKRDDEDFTTGVPLNLILHIHITGEGGGGSPHAGQGYHTSGTDTAKLAY